MVDLNVVEQFSPFGGKLVKEEVPGKLVGVKMLELEGMPDSRFDRSMYVYVPASGCPCSKQTQALIVLRDNSDEDSAEEVMVRLGLDKLAEEKHVMLLFPNPMDRGWNYNCDKEGDNEADFLARCVAILRKSEIGTYCISGLQCFIADSESASAMLMTVAALSPKFVPAMMVSKFPEGYEIPKNALNIPVAAWCSNETCAQYLLHANNADVDNPVTLDDGVLFRSRDNKDIRLIVSDKKIDQNTVYNAWENLFHVTRRWQNDTYGTYQERADFYARGLVAHINDSSLGINNGFGHTWFEYIPPQLRGTAEKVPLVIYCHGAGCVPLYGAEQSGWHNIADKENFIVVYPSASKNHKWNIWSDPFLMDDEAFLLALIEHMKEVHPIDETRIYISGFSMGSMMTQTMVTKHPDLFAAAAPCDGYFEGYFKTWPEMEGGFAKKNGKEFPLPEGYPKGKTVSDTRLVADRKKAEMDYRMPVILLFGLNDGKWPMTAPEDPRLRTFSFWRTYNNIPDKDIVYDSTYESGLIADESFYEGADARFLHHRWLSEDAGRPSLYEALLTKRMPHALDLRSVEIAWAFMKKFSRNPDGTLNIMG